MDGFLEFLTHFTGFVIAAAVNCLPLCLIVGAVTFFGQRWISARIRFHLWTLVLLRLLLPFSFESPLGLGQWWNYLPSGQAVAGNSARLIASESTLPMPAVITKSALQNSPPPPPAAAFGWVAVFSSGVIFGLPLVTALLAIWFALTSLRLSRQVQRGKCSDRPEWETLLQEGRSEFGIRRPVQLRILDNWAAPAMIGFIRPVILLPSDSDDLNSAELKHVIWHELAHVRRGDAAWNWLWMIVCGLHWWNPVFWWVQSNWLAERELACDALAVSRLGASATDYGKTLLHFLERISQSTCGDSLLPLSRLVCLLGEKRVFRRRLVALANPVVASARWRGWLQAAVIVLLGIIGLTDASESAPRSTDSKAMTLPAGTVWVSTSEELKAAQVPSGPTDVRHYNITQVVKRFHDDEPKIDAESEICSLVQGYVGLFPWKKGQPQTDVACIKDGELIVRATDVQHRKIQQILEQWKEFGLQQIVVEIRMISTEEPLNSFLPDAAGRVISAAPTKDVDLLSPFEEAQTIRQSVTCPSFVRTMTAAEVAKAVSILQGQPRSNLLQAPKVTMFNGGTAIVKDSIVRPFVTGLRTTTSGEVLPDVSNVEQGVQIAVRGFVAGSDGSVQIEFQVRRSEIIDVEVLTTRIDGLSRETSIQLPHVSESNFRTSAKLSPDESILVAPLRRDSLGKLHLCLISARQLPPQ